MPPSFRLSEMTLSLWVPQAIYAAAALGIPDELSAGAKHSDELAGAIGTHPGATHRLLRALALLELCTGTENGGFELTPLGECLRSDSSGSVRS